MRKGDVQLVNPNTWLAGEKAAIEALSGVAEGSVAWATDTDEPGWYDGASWEWGFGVVTGVHSDLTGLVADDHPQYVLVDGSRAFTLTDNGGTSKVSIEDSDTTEVAYIDSDGNVLAKGHFSFGNLASENAQAVVWGYEELVGAPATGSFGFVSQVSKTTAGASIDDESTFTAIYADMNLDLNGYTVGALDGGYISVRQTDGDVQYGVSGMTLLTSLTAGVVGTSATGVTVQTIQGASHEVTGSVYGLVVDTRVAGTVGGSSYGLYLITDNNGPDFAVYETGTSPWYIGGNVGIYAAPTTDKLTVGGAASALSVQATGTTAPAAGAGTELMHDGTDGYVTGYNRTTTAYTSLKVRGAPLALCYQGTSQLSMQNGYVQVDGAFPIKGTGSNYPDLGSTTAAEKWGNIYLGASKDLYPKGDTYGLHERAVTYSRTPNEHWSAGTDDLSWSWASYTGFSTPNSLYTSYPSFYMISDTGVIKAFKYRTHGGAAATYYLRAAVNYQATGGIMIDDGTDAGDGLGANNFVRVCLYTTTGPTTLYRVEVRTGGGSITTTTITPYIDPERFHTFLLYHGSAPWSAWSFGAYMYGEYMNSKLLSWQGTYSWTPARYGIYYENYAGSAQNRLICDWGIF